MKIKKLFRSKKTLVTLCLLLVVAIVSGATFAWFTWSVDSYNSEVQVGRLTIEADYGSASAWQLEPGSSETRTGEIRNTGTLNAFAKVDLTEGTVTIWSDEDGKPLSSGETILLSNSKADGINVTLLESAMVPAGGNGNGASYLWMQDYLGNYYISMWGNASAELAFEIEAEGSVGNLMQGAVVNFTQGWDATQMIDDAIFEKYDIVYNDPAQLRPMGAWDSGSGRSMAAATNSSLVDELYARFLEDAAR